MPLPIPSAGHPHPRVFILGERPGYEEWGQRRNFVGPAGKELWSRLTRICQLDRKECYVANLVRTFSTEPPTNEEIDRDWPLLQADLQRTRPPIIATVGYHAARRLLGPDYARATGDQFHGLVFEVDYGGHGSPRTALLVPLVHSSAALRQPERYQNQFTNDCRVLRAVLDGTHVLHAPVRPPLWRVGLATTLAEAVGGVVGLDSEGSLTRPWAAECLTLSSGAGDAAALLETAEGDETSGLIHVQAILDEAHRISIHHAKHDLKVLRKLGLTWRDRQIDDTMEMAYLLGLPQGLKELMLRRHGWQMDDYWDLILPLDEARVRALLETWAQSTAAVWDAFLLASTLWMKMTKAAKKLPYTQKRKALATIGAPPLPPTRPKRAVTSIKGMLTKPAEDTLRKRWTNSTFANSIPLPPEPTWKDLPQGVREPYALTDALAHRVLRQDLWREVCAKGLDRAYRVDMAVLPWLIRNEEVGLAVDRKKLEGLSVEFRRQFEEVSATINDLAGYVVNPLSGPQVSDCLFTELGITPTRATPTKTHYTTADKYLKARRKEHEIVPLILTARQLNKYLGTYTDKLPEMLQRVGDLWRYFPDWKYTRTATGRLAEIIVLLIPKHDPLAKKEGRRNRAKLIRNCFHAARGNVLVSVDLSQIELRVMADLSQDPRLLDAYRKGEDIHANVAHELLGAPKQKKDQDESAHRLPAKTLNFGIINGMTEYGMLDQLHEAGELQWTIESVRDLLDGWWDLHVGVDDYWNGQIAHAREHGWIEEPLFGRRREVTAVWTADDRVYSEATRHCLFGIQSAADSISKVWNAAMWKEIILPRQRRGVYCEPWIRVHDDTVLEVDAREAEQVKAEMLGLVPQLLSIPTLAEGKLGERWGDIA